MKTLRTRQLSAAMVLASLIALASCSPLPTAPSPESFSSGKYAQPAGVAVVKITGSQVINGAVGGTVKAGRWQVTIPAGAYTGSGTVTVTVPDTTVARVDLSISPSTLNDFAVPAVLRYQCLSAAEAQAFTMLWWNTTTKAWTTIPSWADLTNSTRWTSINHFSSYASGKAGWKPR